MVAEQSTNSQSEVIPRSIPEGTVPLICVEGPAYQCGREYAEITMEKYPGYRTYLDQASHLADPPDSVRKLYEDRAPYILEVFRGIYDIAGPPERPQEPQSDKLCTSFGLSGSVTLDGEPISGQTKDTRMASAYQYIVLRMRITDGPTILVLAYPGEVLGYGFWSTGMSIFRNSLHSTAGAETGLTMDQWAFLALAGKSVREGAELAREFGLAGSGNCLISDEEGESISVEFNAGGVNIIPAKNGIATHANHPEGPDTAAFEKWESEIEKDNSRYRMHGLWKLLDAERGKLTAQKVLMILADHTRYPLGICRHMIDGKPGWCTTAAVVAQPTRGKLHVVRGQPCCNWPVTYTM